MSAARATLHQRLRLGSRGEGCAPARAPAVCLLCLHLSRARPGVWFSVEVQQTFAWQCCTHLPRVRSVSLSGHVCAPARPPARWCSCFCHIPGPCSCCGPGAWAIAGQAHHACDSTYCCAFPWGRGPGLGRGPSPVTRVGACLMGEPAERTKSPTQAGNCRRDRRLSPARPVSRGQLVLLPPSSDQHICSVTSPCVCCCHLV